MALRKRAIIASINADCAIRRRYANEQGETCAIGGLALSAGVPISVLLAAENKRIATNVVSVTSGSETTRENLKALRTIRRAIHRRFGLTIAMLSSMQMRNDMNTNPRDRRTDILDFVDGLGR